MDYIQAEAPCNPPIFILKHVKHAAQRMQSGPSRLYAAFNKCHLLTSNKLMIAFQDISFGAIYAVARCLTISYPSSKTCTTLTNIRYWMGIRQPLCCHLSVLNKDVPSSLCCLPST